MRVYRPAASYIGAALTAAALTFATCLPSAAATSPGWRVVFRSQFGMQGATLYSVAAPTPAIAWAVGGGGAIGSTQSTPVAAQWNGTAWQAATLPSGLTGTLGAVSAPAGNDVWAVSELTGYVLHWNGTTWAVARKWKESQQARELTGVTAFSPTDVWVFGGPGFGPGLGTWHLSGGTWTRVTGLASGIDTASALSPASIWAITGVNRPQDTLLHYNGTTWQQLSSPVLSGRQFNDILALSASNIWATASAPQRPTAELVHFDGHHWSSVPVTAPAGVKQLGAIASDGHGGLWIGGASLSQSAWALHRSAAGVWSSQKLVTGGVGSVFGFAHIPGTTSVWATGSLGTPAAVNGTVWGHGSAT